MDFVRECFNLFVSDVLEEAEAVVWSVQEELAKFLEWKWLKLAFKDVRKCDGEDVS